jgi:hypothetical protein
VFLAPGYLATAALAAAHLLSFHGPFAPGKLLAAGRRPRHGSIWRGTRVFRRRSFLNAVAGALVVERRNRVAMLAALVLGAIVAALIVLRTPGHALLAPIMDGKRANPPEKFVAGGVCLVTVAALLSTIDRRRRAHCDRRQLRDLWLSLAMYAWTYDVMLNGMLNAGGFDLGLFAGRIFGVLAVSLVLTDVVLLAIAGRYPGTER